MTKKGPDPETRAFLRGKITEHELTIDSLRRANTQQRDALATLRQEVDYFRKLSENARGTTERTLRKYGVIQ